MVSYTPGLNIQTIHVSTVLINKQPMQIHAACSTVSKTMVNNNIVNNCFTKYNKRA